MIGSLKDLIALAAAGVKEMPSQGKVPQVEQTGFTRWPLYQTLLLPPQIDHGARLTFVYVLFLSQHQGSAYSRPERHSAAAMANAWVLGQTVSMIAQRRQLCLPWPCQTTMPCVL